jgi:hypothetical protein
VADALSVGDRLAIADVIVRYASGIDSRDWEQFRTCFTQDAILDYGAIGSWRGVEAFTAYNVEAHQPFGATMHRISNIAMKGIGPDAAARSYVDAVLYTPDGELQAQARGYYDDRLTTLEGDWKIAERRFTTVQIVAEVPETHEQTPG